MAEFALEAMWSLHVHSEQRQCLLAVPMPMALERAVKQLLADDILMGRAEIIREKGTDRARFLRGQVDKYSWQDIGSSYLPSELNAAVLDAQLAEFHTIQRARQLCPL